MMLARLIQAFNSFNNNRKIQKEQSDAAIAQGPSWRHRRRLIYGAYFVAIGMIAFGAFSVSYMSEVSVQMIIGGVALLSIILTSYTVVATYEDVRLWKGGNPISPEEDPGNVLDSNSHDGI